MCRTNPERSSRDDSPILLPKPLYGGTRKTRTAWASIAKKAWSEGTWENALVDIEMVSIDSFPGPLLVSNDILHEEQHGSYARPRRTRWETNEDVWHLCWILEQHPAPYDELRQHPERHLALVLDGMTYFWYCLGMLQGNPVHLPFLYQHYEVHHATDEVRQKVVHPILANFLGSYARIVQLESRIAIANPRTQLRKPGVESCLGMILVLAMFGGYLDELGVRDGTTICSPYWTTPRNQLVEHLLRKFSLADDSEEK